MTFVNVLIFEIKTSIFRTRFLCDKPIRKAFLLWLFWLRISHIYVYVYVFTFWKSHVPARWKYRILVQKESLRLFNYSLRFVIHDTYIYLHVYTFQRTFKISKITQNNLLKKALNKFMFQHHSTINFCLIST